MNKLLAFSSLFFTLMMCIGAEENEVVPAPFDAIIDQDFFARFSNLENAEDLNFHREEKDEGIEYSVPFGGISIIVAPGYSLLSERALEEDRKAILKSRKELEALLESKKKEYSKEEYEEAAKFIRVFSQGLAGSESERYPELGSQALHTGWTDGDTTTFTTSDEKYDVKIKRMFTKDIFFRVPEMARWLSNTYDKTKTQPGEDSNG